MLRRSFIDADISESSQQLFELLSQQTNHRNYLKVKMLHLLKTGEAKNLKHVAQILNLHYRTLLDWMKKYNQGGLEKLLHISPKGPAAKIMDWVIEQARQELQNAPPLCPSFSDVNIAESSQQLLELLSRQTDQWNQLKIGMLYLLRIREAATFKQAAQILGLSEGTTRKWLKQYEEGDLEQLLHPPKSESKRKAPSLGIERLRQELQNAQLPTYSFFDINITESSQQLLELLSQQTNHRNYLKVKTLYLLKSGEARTFNQAAQILGLHQETPKKWFTTYNEGGLEELLHISSIRSELGVPTWAIERLRQELQNAQFLPEIETVYAWLLTVGVKVGRDKAAEVHSWMKVSLDSLKLDSNSNSLADATIDSSAQLLIEPDIYIQYEHWKTEHGIANDADALHRLMLEFLELNASDQDNTSANNSTPEVITDDLFQPPIIDTKTPTFLNQSDLAKRLGVNNSVLAKNRNKRTFPGWTKQKDPDRIGWQWVPNLRKYQSLPTN